MLHFLSLALCASLFSPNVFADALVKHVIVVSIDGGKPATIQKADMPALHKIAKEGAHSWEAETILPSSTLPSHGSMVSGVDVSDHGLTWNDYKPTLGFIKATTMFAQAKAAGLSTAMIAAKEKFKHLNLPGSIDHFSAVYQNDIKIAENAAAHIKIAKPNLMLIHLAGVDVAGHAHGWDTPKYLEALKIADKALELIQKAVEEAGIANNTLLIVTADHGGSEKSHGSARPEHRNIPWIIWGKKVKADFTLPSHISTMDTPATSLWALGLEIPASWKGVPVREALVF